jgi:hypothetical protein
MIKNSSSRSIEIVKPVSLEKSRIFCLETSEISSYLSEESITVFERIDPQIEMCADDIETTGLHKRSI